MRKKNRATLYSSRRGMESLKWKIMDASIVPNHVFRILGKVA